MSHSSLGETTTGKIVNLITNDVQKLDQVSTNSYRTSFPVQMVIRSFLSMVKAFTARHWTFSL